MLGSKFSSNGDVLAFSNGDEPVARDGLGRASSTSTSEPVGPCITGLVDMRSGQTSTNTW